MPTKDRSYCYKYYVILLEILLVGALAVGIIASISLPRLPQLYIARTHLDGAVIQTSKGLSHNVSEVRFGIWGMCYYSEKEQTCQETHNVTIRQGKDVAVVDWVKFYYALLAQLIATALSFVPTALRLYFLMVIVVTQLLKLKAPPDDHDTCFPVKSLISKTHMSVIMPLAVLAQTESFICNILLYYHIKSNLHKLGATELTGIGFVLTTVSLVYILYYSLRVWVDIVERKLGCRKKRREVDDDDDDDDDEKVRVNPRAIAEAAACSTSQMPHTQFVLQGQVIAPPLTKPK